jgi:hypothetical protein
MNAKGEGFKKKHRKSEGESEEGEQMRAPESLKDIFKISNRNRKKNK